MGTPQRKKNSDKKNGMPPHDSRHPVACTAPSPPTTQNRKRIQAPKKLSVADLSLDRLDYSLNPIADSVTQQAITAFLPRAILFNTCKVLFYVVKSTVKKLRRGLHNPIDGRIAIYQD